MGSCKFQDVQVNQNSRFTPIAYTSTINEIFTWEGFFHFFHLILKTWKIGMLMKHTLN
jgi:hypothetical protein